MCAFHCSTLSLLLYFNAETRIGCFVSSYFKIQFRLDCLLFNVLIEAKVMQCYYLVPRQPKCGKTVIALT